MTSSERRTYAQYCGTARALDVLGERWTLLVVRDLLPGPRRFGELAGRLPGISTDLLTNRLRTLEEHGLVIRTEEPGVGRPVSYRLTPAGQELRPIIEQLADIGARWLPRATDTDDHLDLGWALGAAAAHLRTADVPSMPVVISCPGQRFVLEPGADRVELRYLDEPVASSVVLAGAADMMLATISGHLPLDGGDVEVDGDPTAAAAWVDAIAASVPAAARGTHPPADPSP